MAIKEVTEDLDGEYQFNTGVSELMKLSNALADTKALPVYAEGIKTLILLLAPFAPTSQNCGIQSVTRFSPHAKLA